MVFEIPYDDKKTTDILVPNIQNKRFKISKWFVSVGDFIEKGQIICELESDSITLEFESLAQGKLVYITKSKENLMADKLICKIE